MRPRAPTLRAMNVPPGLTPSDPLVFSESLRRIDATSKAACAVSATPVVMTHNANAPPRRERMSVLRRPLEALDDDHVERRGGVFQPQPELFLHRGKDRDRIDWRRVGAERRRPLEFDIEAA